MLGTIARKLFGTSNDRFVKRLDKPVADINALEPTVKALSDDELRARTQWMGRGPQRYSRFTYSGKSAGRWAL